MYKTIFMLVMRLSFVTNRDFLDVDLFSIAHESDLDSTMQLGIFDDRTAFNYLTRSHYPLCYKKVLLKNNTGNQMIFRVKCTFQVNFFICRVKLLEQF